MKNRCRLFFKRRLVQLLTIPAVAALIGVVLLEAVSFIPTELIRDHAIASAEQLVSEYRGEDFLSPAGRRLYRVDNFTDSIIMETSISLDREHPEYVLLCSITTKPDQTSRCAHLMDTALGNAQEATPYSRYWMGFRVLTRPLLLLTGYRGIRMIAAAVDWALLGLAVAVTAKRGSASAALALALAVGLVEPYAVVGSLQFSTCFILAFALIVLLETAGITLDDPRCFTAFCLCGTLTQFFDFYTYPLITVALPLLLLASRYRGQRLWRQAGLMIGGWAACWLLMWLYKLCLATAFSSDNGFRSAFLSLAQRLGLSGYRVENVSYSPRDAFARVWEYLSLPPAKLVLPALGLAVAGLWACSRFRFGPNGRLGFYLAAALLPVLWMAATPQPIYIHYWFQYRSICVLYLALMLYGLEALGVLNGKSRLARALWKSECSEA